MHPLKFLAALGLVVIMSPSVARDCYESSIVTPSPFMGNDGEIFKLLDGSLWEVKYEYEYLYAYLPNIIICPASGKLAVNGKTLNVTSVGQEKPPVKSRTPQPASESIIESNIDGEFSGWDGETIFKLSNGQIWQQAAYAYTYSYKYRPEVLIIKTRSGYEMQVDGMDSRINVKRLK